VITEIEVIRPDNLLGTAVDGLRMVPGMFRDLAEVNEAQQRLQQEIIESQKQAIEELSTPVIPIMDVSNGGGGIIVMPLIGSIDSLRARDITRSLLAGISQHKAKVVILDATGVPIMDSGVVNHLNKTIRAARLKGARTIVTGISDSVAETIVDLGIDWTEIETHSDLQTGLRVALAGMGLYIKRDANASLKSRSTLSRA
jgi:anti-anti-sigma regulatory factor